LGAATYPLADALGSVRGLTDGSGNLTGTADYDVFGAVRSSSGDSSIFGYTGDQFDPETDFTYLRARYLSPSLGRFLSVDSVISNAPGTQGYNPYTYVANNPTTWVDPSGHSYTVRDTTTAYVLDNPEWLPGLILAVWAPARTAPNSATGLFAGYGTVIISAAVTFPVIACVLDVALPGEQGCIQIAGEMMDKMRRHGSAAGVGTAIGWGIKQLLDAVRDHPEEPSLPKSGPDKGTDEMCQLLWMRCIDEGWEPSWRCADCLKNCLVNEEWPESLCPPWPKRWEFGAYPQTPSETEGNSEMRQSGCQEGLQ
jgi:RHS repeat-associated protein